MVYIAAMHEAHLRLTETDGELPSASWRGNGFENDLPCIRCSVVGIKYVSESELSQGSLVGEVRGSPPVAFSFVSSSSSSTN